MQVLPLVRRVFLGIGFSGVALTAVSAPPVLSAWFSDQSCKQGTEMDALGNARCGDPPPACDNQTDPPTIFCTSRDSPGYPSYRYCSCTDIVGSPKDSSVCHRYGQQDVAMGLWTMMCTKGDSCAPQQCKMVNVSGLWFKCTCQ